MTVTNIAVIAYDDIGFGLAASSNVKEFQYSSLVTVQEYPTLSYFDCFRHQKLENIAYNRNGSLMELDRDKTIETNGMGAGNHLMAMVE